MTQQNVTLSSSYDLSTFSIDARSEIRRLNAQLDLFWDQEFSLYQKLGLRDGVRLLDCGCGPGHLLQKIAAALPNVEATGIDPDPLLLELASETARKGGLKRVHFLQQSATEMDFPEASFDIVIMRLVLEHLPQPLPALREVLRVLKPGGAAIIIDNDFELHERTWPDCPALNDLYAAYREARMADGGNPCIGRELPCLLRQAGFGNLSLNMVAAHSGISGDEAFLHADGAGIPAQLVQSGFLEPDVLQEITEQWAGMLSAENHSIFRTLFVGAGEKLSSFQAAQASETARNDDEGFHDPGTGTPPGDVKRSLTPEDLGLMMRQVLETEMEMPVGTLSLTEPLIEAGVDSLAALRLCNRVKRDYGAVLKIADVISGKSIEELVQNVLSEIEHRQTVSTSAIPIQPRHRN